MQAPVTLLFSQILKQPTPGFRVDVTLSALLVSESFSCDVLPLNLAADALFFSNKDLAANEVWIKTETQLATILTSILNANSSSSSNATLLAIFTVRKHRNGDSESATTSRLTVRFRDLNAMRIQQLLRAELNKISELPGRKEITHSLPSMPMSASPPPPPSPIPPPAACSSCSAFKIAESTASKRLAEVELALTAEQAAHQQTIMSLSKELATKIDVITSLEFELEKLAANSVTTADQIEADIQIRASVDSRLSSASTINSDQQLLPSNEERDASQTDGSSVVQLEQKLAAVNGTLEFITTQYLQTSQENQQLRHKLSTGFSATLPSTSFSDSSIIAPSSPPPERSESAIVVPYPRCMTPLSSSLPSAASTIFASTPEPIRRFSDNTALAERVLELQSQVQNLERQLSISENTIMQLNDSRQPEESESIRTLWKKLAQEEYEGRQNKQHIIRLEARVADLLNQLSQERDFAQSIKDVEQEISKEYPSSYFTANTDFDVSSSSSSSATTTPPKSAHTSPAVFTPTKRTAKTPSLDSWQTKISQQVSRIKESQLHYDKKLDILEHEKEILEKKCIYYENAIFLMSDKAPSHNDTTTTNSNTLETKLAATAQALQESLFQQSTLLTQIQHLHEESQQSRLEIQTLTEKTDKYSARIADLEIRLEDANMKVAGVVRVRRESESRKEAVESALRDGYESVVKGLKVEVVALKNELVAWERRCRELEDEKEMDAMVNGSDSVSELEIKIKSLEWQLKQTAITTEKEFMEAFEEAGMEMADLEEKSSKLVKLLKTSRSQSKKLEETNKSLVESLAQKEREFSDLAGKYEKAREDDEEDDDEKRSAKMMDLTQEKEKLVKLLKASSAQCKHLEEENKTLRSNQQQHPQPDPPTAVSLTSMSVELGAPIPKEKLSSVTFAIGTRGNQETDVEESESSEVEDIDVLKRIGRLEEHVEELEELLEKREYECIHLKRANKNLTHELDERTARFIAKEKGTYQDYVEALSNMALDMSTLEDKSKEMENLLLASRTQCKTLEAELKSLKNAHSLLEQERGFKNTENESSEKVSHTLEDMTLEMGELEEKVATLEGLLKESHIQIKKLEEANPSLWESNGDHFLSGDAKKLKALESEKDELLKLNNDFKEIVSDLRMCVVVMETQLAGKDTEICALAEKLNDKDLEASNRPSLQDFTAEIIDLEHHVSSLKTQLASAQEQYSKLELNNLSLTRTLSHRFSGNGIKEKVGGLESRISDLEDVLATKNAEIVTLKEKESEYLGTMENLSLEASCWEENAAKLKSELKSSQERVFELEADVGKHALSNQTRELASESRCNELQQQNSLLSSYNEQSNLQILKLSSEVTQLQKALSAAQQSLQNITTEYTHKVEVLNDNLSSAIVTAVELRTKHATELNQLEAAIKSLRAELQESHDTNAALEVQVASLKEQLANASSLLKSRDVSIPEFDVDRASSESQSFLFGTSGEVVPSISHSSAVLPSAQESMQVIDQEYSVTVIRKSKQVQELEDLLERTREELEQQKREFEYISEELEQANAEINHLQITTAPMLQTAQSFKNEEPTVETVLLSSTSDDLVAELMEKDKKIDELKQQLQSASHIPEILESWKDAFRAQEEQMDLLEVELAAAQSQLQKMQSAGGSRILRTALSDASDAAVVEIRSSARPRNRGVTKKRSKSVVSVRTSTSPHNATTRRSASVGPSMPHDSTSLPPLPTASLDPYFVVYNHERNEFELPGTTSSGSDSNQRLIPVEPARYITVLCTMIIHLRSLIKDGESQIQHLKRQVARLEEVNGEVNGRATRARTRIIELETNNRLLEARLSRRGKRLNMLSCWKD
ncbi:UNVERIFIED_CONTAM: hypothetical protein HDU68_009734 [Siphonaria sp. JEL0065]|nr:hypothetical protein HDU68_009734 [Siphonaria sp. JEL0065]